MQKLFLMIIVLFGFASCQEDVKFNNPSLQGLKDNLFWKAVDAKATLASDRTVLIEAYTSNEIISLKTTSTKVQTYLLRKNTSNRVAYTRTVSGEKVTYSTGFDIGNGQIVITEYDAVNKTITGTFKFNAENTDDSSLASPTVNFQQGVFYKVPVSSAVLIDKQGLTP
jgi:Family of unknown function (DUF6252)